MPEHGEVPPILSQPICRGGRAVSIGDDESQCPRCDYTFTTVDRDPTAVPPHWVVTDDFG